MFQCINSNDLVVGSLDRKKLMVIYPGGILFTNTLYIYYIHALRSELTDKVCFCLFCRPPPSIK